MKINFDKYHLSVSSNNENRKIELTRLVIKNTQMKKILVAHVGYK